MQSNNGLEFNNNNLKAVCSKYNINHLFSNSYHLNSNGYIKHFNATVKNMLFKHFSNSDTKIWTLVLLYLIWNYNSAYHSIIKITPENVFNNKLDVSSLILKNTKKMLHNSGDHSRPLRKGTYVRIALKMSKITLS